MKNNCAYCKLYATVETRADKKTGQAVQVCTYCKTKNTKALPAKKKTG